MGLNLEKVLKNLRRFGKHAGESVAVYQSSSSGPNQYALVTRYKQGLKERATGFRKPMKERYEATNGEDSWDDYFDMLKTCVEKRMV